MSDEPESSDGDEASLTELVEQLARDTSRLTLHEAALGASRHVPELRRVALWAGLAIAVAASFVAAFALANWAAVAGLSTWLPTWLAPLVLAAAWTILGVALLLVARSRLRRGSTGVWVRLLGDERLDAVVRIQASRDEAEQAVRDSLERVGVALAAASAAQLTAAVLSRSPTASATSSSSCRKMPSRRSSRASPGRERSARSSTSFSSRVASACGP
jgi:hypothetical protein